MYLKKQWLIFNTRSTWHDFIWEKAIKFHSSAYWSNSSTPFWESDFPHVLLWIERLSQYGAARYLYMQFNNQNDTQWEDSLVHVDIASLYLSLTHEMEIPNQFTIWLNNAFTSVNLKKEISCRLDSDCFTLKVSYCTKTLLSWASPMHTKLTNPLSLFFFRAQHMVLPLTTIHHGLFISQHCFGYKTEFITQYCASAATGMLN